MAMPEGLKFPVRICYPKYLCQFARGLRKITLVFITVNFTEINQIYRFLE